MEALGIDIKLLIAQVINFILFFIIFKRFVSKPFFNYLHEAQKKEKEKDRIVTELAEREEKAKETEKELFKKARTDAEAIMTDAKKTAAVQAANIIKKAQSDATDIKEKAEKVLDEERRELYAEVKKHVVETSAAIAKSALADYLNEDKQRELTTILVKKADRVRYEN